MVITQNSNSSTQGRERKIVEREIRSAAQPQPEAMNKGQTRELSRNRTLSLKAFANCFLLFRTRFTPFCQVPQSSPVFGKFPGQCRDLKESTT